LLNNLIIAAIPHTEPWGFNTAFVMIVCNLVAVAILLLNGYLNRRDPISNPTARNGKSALTQQFTLPELLATFSFGHLVGVGMVLGLTNIGTI
jgi:photosystem I subunit X